MCLEPKIWPEAGKIINFIIRLHRKLLRISDILERRIGFITPSLEE